MPLPLLSVLLTVKREVYSLDNYKIQKVFRNSFSDFCKEHPLMSDVQKKTAIAISDCKSERLGFHISRCDDCGHIQIHYSSCRNRHCPCCQSIPTEIWVDRRSAEVIDAPYFHAVFTLPHELNSLLYCNQKLLYSLFHRCCAQTVLELSSDPKWLGAVPGIIQVLHTWNQELGYHVHMHCIVSGGGLTRDGKVRTSSAKFFIPVRVMRDKFKGKFLAQLSSLYENGDLEFSQSCDYLRSTDCWKAFKNSLYEKDWCPYIKETFNGFGNAIEYLGRYTHKIAISNSRIVSVSENQVTFSARGKRPGEPKRRITLNNTEFIRRYLMHVLPSGFQKIRYYGFLNNRMKAKNLKLIFKIQNGQRFKQRYAGMTTAQLLKAVWNIDICRCPVCGHSSMKQAGIVYKAPS
jgi:hypothetical protein